MNYWLTKFSVCFGKWLQGFILGNYLWLWGLTHVCRQVFAYSKFMAVFVQIVIFLIVKLVESLLNFKHEKHLLECPYWNKSAKS